MWKKCDMFLIALGSRWKIMISGEIHEISRNVIHVVVGERRERTEKILAKMIYVTLTFITIKIYLAYNWISNCILMESW